MMDTSDIDNLLKEIESINDTIEEAIGSSRALTQDGIINDISQSLYRIMDEIRTVYSSVELDKSNYMENYTEDEFDEDDSNDEQ